MSDAPDPDREAFEADARELRALYVASREADLDRLVLALAARDFATARSVGHVFKGSGATFGYPEASRLGLALEEAAGARDDAACSRIAAALRRLLEGPAA